MFTVSPAGDFTSLYSFPNGWDPIGLIQGTDGKFYGETVNCGTGTYGTIYSLDMGLGPFVAFVRPYGKSGQTAEILGQGLTGATGVSFNGTSADFTVVSDTFIDATVPVGATTGFVTVAAGGTLTSNAVFYVVP